MAPNNNHNKPKILEGIISRDITLPSGPQDTISAVRWAPIHDYLAAPAWDGKIYIYDVSQPQSAKGLAAISTEAPVFDCDFNKDETIIAAAGADNTLSIIDTTTLQRQPIPAAHAKPIRACRFVDIPACQGSPVVATGSWDGTVRYWDLRANPLAPAATVAVGERVYAMDVAGPTLAVVTAESKIVFIDLRAGDVTKPRHERKSPLPRQNTCLALSGKGARVAVGAIDGRMGVQSVQDGANPDTLTWRCHRSLPFPNPTNPRTKEVKVYAVNTVAFLPTSRNETVVASAGSDGTFHFWDTQRQSRLRAFPSVGGPITACGFSARGGLFAYAVGYDWAAGYKGSVPPVENKVVVHVVGKGEVEG